MSEEKPTQLPLPLSDPANGESTVAAGLPASIPREAVAAPSDSAPMARATEGPGDAATRSPFAGHIPTERPTGTGEIGVRLTMCTLQSVIQLATWPTGVSAWESAMQSALGSAPSSKTGDVLDTKLGLVMRIGPEELMLVSNDGAHGNSTDTVAKLREAVRADIGSVLDLSHARCRIRIEGEHCVNTLSKLFALDFREEAFPVGRGLLSSHHHVPCALHRTGSAEFDAYVFTTYAREMLETIADAALEFGVAAKAD